MHAINNSGYASGGCHKAQGQILSSMTGILMAKNMSSIHIMKNQLENAGRPKRTCNIASKIAALPVSP